MVRRFIVVASCAFASLMVSAASAQDAEEPAVVVRVQVGALSAPVGSVIGDVGAIRTRAESLLEPCRAEGLAAREPDGARVRLTIDARGRVVAATVLAEGEVSEAARRWHRCATRALSRLRFPAGGAGTMELLARWGPDRGAMGQLSAVLGSDADGNFGHGGLGLRGTGRGGGGIGEGTIGLGSGGGSGRSQVPGRPPPPQVRTGMPEVSGSLSPEVIRRVIRRHINEVRFCYERMLNERTGAGRIEVTFTIDAEGSVARVSIASDTLGDSALSTCLLRVVQRWRFPAPSGGGVVLVTYPFVFGGTQPVPGRDGAATQEAEAAPAQ